MFSKTEKVTYIEIRSRINALKGTPFTAHLSADVIKYYFGEFKGVSVNQLLANPDANSSKIAEISSKLKANKIDKKFHLVLDRLIGCAINSPDEYQTFLEGLATNAMAYGEKSFKDVVQHYKDYPEFVIVRLLETIDLAKSLPNV